MQHDVRKYLKDVLVCVAEIEQFTAGKTLQNYEENTLLRRAVEREFTIIAEALRRTARISPELQFRVDSVRQIADFRNIIVHDYENVDDVYVWQVVHSALPVLKSQIEKWMDALNVE